MGKRIKELERLYGIEHGGDRKSSSNNYNLKTQKQLADEMGISMQTLQNYKKLTELVSELQDWVETGILAPANPRALISNNFGRRKNDSAKDRKALKTYVSLRGYKHGEIGNGRKKTCQNGTSTLDEIAKELNISKQSPIRDEHE